MGRFLALTLCLLLAACGSEPGKVCTTHLEVRLADPSLLTGVDRALIQIETNGAPVMREVNLSGVGAGVPIEIPDTGDVGPSDSFRLTFAAYSGNEITAIGRSEHFGCLGEADQQVPLYIGPAGGFATLTTSVQSRIQASGSALPGGQVLIFGGSEAPAALVYDHSAGTLCASDNPGCNLSSPPPARIHHTATVLLDGQVLLVGGKDLQDNVLTAATLFDPASGNFNKIGDLETGRYWHAAVLLSGSNTASDFQGKVLVAGGLDENDQALASAELIDPATGDTETYQMITPRYDTSASMLGSGEVLVAGGRGEANELLDSVDLFDSSTTGTGLFDTTQVHLCPGADSTLCAKRAGHTATVIQDQDHNVLLWGGEIALATGADGPPPTSEVFSVLDVKGLPTQASTADNWNGHSTTVINCPNLPCPVLVFGGGGSSGLYMPREKSNEQYLGTFLTFSQPPDDRTDHLAVSLQDGTVLVFGGNTDGPTALVFSPCKDIGSLHCPGM